MSFLHPLELSRSILDPIHGLVRLTDEEVRVVNHVVYQRLRKVKQNGLLHLVFPSATHTRFEHSIGVLFVADSMLHALVFNSIASRNKQKNKQNKVAPFNAATSRQAIDFSEAPSEQVRDLFRITRLAALVHDLGHGPLSHTFDRFAPTRSAALKLLEEPSLESIRDFKDVFEHYEPDQRRVPHEVMSCIFFAKIWHDLDIERQSPWVPKAVTAVILGGEEAFGKIDAPRAPWVTLAHDLVSSAPADADRMDYLERDSRSCGVTYGLFDRNRLLKSMLCYRDETSAGTRYRLGLKLSGYRAVENFVQARFELFVQVYYHKTNRAIESMLAEISRLAGEKTIINERSLPHLINGYTRLSDEYFLDVLRGETVCGISPIDNDRIKELANLIHERKPWKRIFDLQNQDIHRSERDAKDEDRVQKILKKVESLRAILEEESGEHTLHLDKVDAKATKDLAKGAAILIPVNDVYTATDKPDWEARSPLIEALGKGERMVARIFAKDTARIDPNDYRNRARTHWSKF